MSTEAITHGHACGGGSPTSGTNGIATSPAPIAISTVTTSGSRPRLIVAFHAAWAAAANRTAVKTKESIGGLSIASLSTVATTNPPNRACFPRARLVLTMGSATDGNHVHDTTAGRHRARCGA